MATKSDRADDEVPGTVGRKTRRAYKRVSPVMRPLLELFATVDDVMSEHDAFDEQNIHKSLGRIYREWLNTREQLDPDFDRARYRHEMKEHLAAKPRRSPLGRELPASGSTRSSTESTSTSGKKPKKSARPEKPSRQKSAKGARSGGSASTGPSSPKSRGAYGAVSRSGSASGSGSGSKRKASERSRKAKG